MKALWRFTLLASATAVMCLSAFAFAQDLPRIAVYVTGNAGNDEKKALETRMLSALVNSGRYRGIERSSAFLAEIEKEQLRQRSGAIDDSQISKLGRQFGVKFICIADMTFAFGAYQVSARVVDVETAEVVSIGDASSQLKTMADLEKVSNLVVKNMLGGQAAPAPQSKPQAARPAPVMGIFKDSRDGKSYKKVTIGRQTWMAENLNRATPKSKCYGDASANCAKYGRLYDWADAMKACPAGWHLPGDDEWTTLIDYVGGVESELAGTRLKSKNYWDSYRGVESSGTDEYGFSALPGGYCAADSPSPCGKTYYGGRAGVWWSSTEGGLGAWSRGMTNFGEGVLRGSYHKSSLASVRCVQD